MMKFIYKSTVSEIRIYQLKKCWNYFDDEIYLQKHRKIYQLQKWTARITVEWIKDYNIITLNQSSIRITTNQ